MITIEQRAIGNGEPAFIIAEAGVNHNGDPATAMRMVDAAAAAKVDCVKFQTFTAEEFVGNAEDTYEYVSQGKAQKESMLAMFRRLELKRDEFGRLFSRARALGLIPLSTPADRAAVDLLESLGVGGFKIGSDDLVYTPFLRYVAEKGKPMILSTGMASTADIDRAVRTIEATGNRQILLLHCVSQYPTPEGDVNLRKISALKSRYDYPVGFSDHSVGTTAALGAIALGACVLEKHFTLDRSLPGPDHRFSADSEELAALVRDVRRLEKNLGTSALVPTMTEEQMAKLCHRSIVAVTALSSGTVLETEHLGFKRPGTGLMPYELESVVGRRLRQSVEPGMQIKRSMLDGGG
jgi:N,N'-diacetyllegionaminate synthase